MTDLHRAYALVGLAVLLTNLAGCLATPTPSVTNPRPEPGLQAWEWRLPDASGTFTARFQVDATDGPLDLEFSSDAHLPNQQGELVEFESHWENGSIAGGGGSWLMPGANQVFARAYGNDLEGPTPLPPLPLDNAAPLSWHFRTDPPASGNRVLVVSVAALRDATQASPLTASVRLHASTPALHEICSLFVPDAVHAFFLSRGGFDGPTGSRIRAGIIDAAATTQRLAFETRNYTFVWGVGRLEGSGPVGVGSISVTGRSPLDSFHADAGPGTGSDLTLHYPRPYGARWDVDVEFAGEGYLFLAYADLPLRPLG